MNYIEGNMVDMVFYRNLSIYVYIVIFLDMGKYILDDYIFCDKVMSNYSEDIFSYMVLYKDYKF